MARFLKSRQEVLGKKPGELVFIGSHKNEDIRVTLMDYTSERVSEDDRLLILDEVKHMKSESKSWINIDGLHDLNIMKKIEENFQLHPIMMADIINTTLRPKIEEFNGGILFIFKMLRYVEEEKKVIAEQFSMILRDNMILTFQEYPGDVFDPIRDRIRSGKGRIGLSKIDYLAYSIIDSIVDNYISIIERIGEQIENNEEEILVNHQPEVMEKIILLKREMIYLRKAIRPAIEAIQFFYKCENELLEESTKPFIKDLYNNVLQLSEAIDTYREMLSDQLNTYNSIVSNHLNDIMKFLTIFSVVFIPLTFIAGVYGTNFDFIPELHFKYGYLMLWGIFFLLATIMIIIFKKKKWL
jgi:magnesium transporter